MMPSNWSKNAPGDKILIKRDSTKLIQIISMIPFEKISELSLTRLIYKSLGIKGIFYAEGQLVLERDPYQTKEIILFDRNILKTEYTDDAAVNNQFWKDRSNVLKQMQEYFQQAKIITDKSNIKIIFVIIPSRLNLHLYNGTVKIEKYRNIQIDPELPSELVSNVILDSGFDEDSILDLGKLPELKANTWRQYYYNIDAHMNPEGNKLIAKSILTKLGL